MFIGVSNNSKSMPQGAKGVQEWRKTGLCLTQPCQKKMHCFTSFSFFERQSTTVYISQLN